MKNYQYINFELIEEKPKTKVWRCNNKKGDYELGIVKWYPPWRQYCYFPSVQATYSKGCLDDIADFIKVISWGKRIEIDEDYNEQDHVGIVNG